MTLEELIAHIKERTEWYSKEAEASLKRGNNLAYNVYIERAIALEDVLTWAKTHTKAETKT